MIERPANSKATDAWRKGELIDISLLDLSGYGPEGPPRPPKSGTGKNVDLSEVTISAKPLADRPTLERHALKR